VAAVYTGISREPILRTQVRLQPGFIVASNHLTGSGIQNEIFKATDILVIGALYAKASRWLVCREHSSSRIMLLTAFGVLKSDPKFYVNSLCDLSIALLNCNIVDMVIETLSLFKNPFGPLGGRESQNSY
jgi:hypothetical protein